MLQRIQSVWILTAAIALAGAIDMRESYAQMRMSTQAGSSVSAPAGSGMAAGVQLGLVGAQFGQRVHVVVPLGENYALRPAYVQTMASGATFLLNGGGRLDLIGRTPILMELLRVYGIGGIQADYPFSPLGSGIGSLDYGISGAFGSEFFITPKFSYFFEIGGGGGFAKAGPFGSAIGGMNSYF